VRFGNRGIGSWTFEKRKNHPVAEGTLSLADGMSGTWTIDKRGRSHLVATSKSGYSLTQLEIEAFGQKVLRGLVTVVTKE
jgi:hypothetical protein